MAYLNFASATKGSRAAALVTALGSTFYALLYSGSYPATPDAPVSSGALLATLPNSGVAVMTYAVTAASVVNGGTGGTAGTAVVTGTTGTGTKFQANVTISGGAITTVNSIAVAGAYTVEPSNLNAEPVTGGGLTGATLALVMTAQVSMSFTTENGSSNGTVAWLRISTSNTAGAAGIVDLDVGVSGSGASVIITSTAIVVNAPVVETTAAITEQ